MNPVEEREKMAGERLMVPAEVLTAYCVGARFIVPGEDQTL